jgi:hypothetical protein
MIRCLYRSGTPRKGCELRSGPDWHPAPGTPYRTLILNQAQQRAVLTGYQEHYSTARPHQALDQRIPGRDPGPDIIPPDLSTLQIRREPVLSGLINEYERAA